MSKSDHSKGSIDGDYTVVVDTDGNIFAAGNVPTEDQSKKEKGNRVIMMQTTKRVIKIPSARNNKFQFQLVGRLDALFPPEPLQPRDPILHHHNPLASLDDFRDPAWLNRVILSLKPWIDQVPINNKEMAAKVAYHSERYQDCLRLSLFALIDSVKGDHRYFHHTRETESDSRADDAVKKTAITQSVSKRIKEISLSVLNESPYPVADEHAYRNVSCCCDEKAYFKHTDEGTHTVLDNNLSSRAALVVDECLGSFPVDSHLWETCFRFVKEFYTDNALSTGQLEAALQQQRRLLTPSLLGSLMSDAQLLSPRLYLSLCNRLLDSWEGI